MSIGVVCNHCNRSYRVPPEMAGKRVRCKACGNAFVIVAVAQTNPRAPLPDDQWVVNPAPGARVPSGGVGRVFDALALFKPNHWVLLSCVLIAAGVGLLGSRMPAIWWGTLIAFPALAVLFILAALVVGVRKELQSPSVQWRNQGSQLLWLLVPFLIGGLGALLVYRWWRPERAQQLHKPSEFATKTFWSLVVAVMPLVTIVVAIWAGTYPHESNSAFGQRLPGTHANPRQLEQSERHLRLIASRVLTYRENAHTTPTNLRKLFSFDPMDLSSPFDPNEAIGYVYIPANVAGQANDSIIAYDRMELEKLGQTQAITAGSAILTLSRDQLFARPDVPAEKAP
jgi:energy-coupling factor transporter transmembrane protein EcfT